MRRSKQNRGCGQKLFILALLALGACPLEARERWQTRATKHFRLLYLAEEGPLVRDLGRRVERMLRARLRYFDATMEELAWTRRCDIYLYPTQRDLIHMTGGDPKAGSASSRPSQLYQGKILARRINVAASDPRLLSSTLPHEITHIVVNELLGGEAPRWANEGLATLAEPRRVQLRNHRMVAHAAAMGALFPVKTLMNLKHYPGGRRRALFYAQSMSLTKFLVDLATPSQFILFLQVAELYDDQRALWAVYDLNSYADLERRWLASRQNAAN